MNLAKSATLTFASLVLGLVAGSGGGAAVHAGHAATCGNTNCVPLGDECFYEANWHCTQSKNGCIGAHKCDIEVS